MIAIREKGLLGGIIALIVFVAVLHIIALKFYFYWSIAWLDPIVHFLGGLSAGLFLLWVYYFSGMLKHVNRNNLIRSFYFSIIGTLIIGIIWEIIEYKLGLTSYSVGFVYDTLSDLSMDISGGLLAYYYFTYYNK